MKGPRKGGTACAEPGEAKYARVEFFRIISHEFLNSSRKRSSHVSYLKDNLKFLLTKDNGKSKASKIVLEITLRVRQGSA